MINNYNAPSIEIIEIELEDAVLGVSDFSKGFIFGDDFYDDSRA